MACQWDREAWRRGEGTAWAIGHRFVGGLELLVRDNAPVTHRSYRELTDIAVQQGRHLETVVLAALTLVVLLSSGGAVVLDSLLVSSREAADLYWVYLPLIVGILACITALATRSVLAPNPGYDGDPPVNPLTNVPLDLEAVCMHSAARENNNRKRALMYGWLGIMLGVLNFTLWVLPQDDALWIVETWHGWCLNRSLPIVLALIFGGHVVGRLASSTGGCK